MIHLDGITLCSDRYPTRTAYPFNLPVFELTAALAFDSPVTLFVGENGTGKSTLLEAIARACGIHIWENAERISFERNPYGEMLHRFVSVAWRDGAVPGSFFASQIFHDFAVNLDEWAASDPGLLKYFGGKSLVVQSHGQSLMSFFKSRFQLRGLYLLDEPETALSPRRQIELLRVIQETTSHGNVQFVIATHSPILLACAGARIFSFDHAPVATVAYEETEHYRLYRDFLVDRSQYL